MTAAEIIAYVAQRERPAVALRMRLKADFERIVPELERQELLDSYPTGDLFGPRVYRLGRRAEQK